MSPINDHDQKVISIEMELEQLLISGTESTKIKHKKKESSKENEEDNDDRRGSTNGSIGSSSNLKERRRDKCSSTRKIKYRRNNHDSELQEGQEHSNFDNKSARSRRSATGTTSDKRGRSSCSSNCNDSTNADSLTNEDAPVKSGSTRTRGSRKIQYNKIKSGTMEDDRGREGSSSVFSKESSRSKKSNSSRSSRKIKYNRNSLEQHETARDNDKDARSTRSRDTARSSRKKSALATKTGLNEFEDWTSGDEMQVPLNLNEIESDDDDDEIPKNSGSRIRRGLNRAHSITINELPSRRQRFASGSIVSDNIILGDPSRRTPLNRSKSQCIRRGSVVTAAGTRMGPPARSQSNDFALFLRQGRQQQTQKRLSRRYSVHADNNTLKFEENDDDADADNPFEVINKGPYESKSSRNSFTSMFDGNNDSNNDFDSDAFSSSTLSQEGKSIGLLKASSKDTISRGIGRAPMIVDGVEKKSTQDGKIEREKQRRVEYNRSIAAATLAGSSAISRRLTSSIKPQRQQSRRHTVSKLNESVTTKLEAALCKE